MRAAILSGIDSQVRFVRLGLSRFRGYRAAYALTRAAPVGRTELAYFIALFLCSDLLAD